MPISILSKSYVTFYRNCKNNLKWQANKSCATDGRKSYGYEGILFQKAHFTCEAVAQSL